jgi:hypothetical protein
VVPLQDLMQDDAVEKAAQSQAEQDACCLRSMIFPVANRLLLWWPATAVPMSRTAEAFEAL